MKDINPAEIAVYMFAFLFSLSFHEFSHGWMALKRGDNTAKLMGRLTLNPMAHADYIGTFALPLIGLITGWALFGWAKPVPVNVRNFKDPKNDMFLVALAGPASNVILAFLGAAVYGLAMGQVQDEVNTRLVQTFFQKFLQMNLALAIFNLIPMHPLDGGKILERFLPYSIARWLEENQGTLNIALIMVMLMGGLRFLAIPIMFIADFLVSEISTPLYRFFGS